MRNIELLTAAEMCVFDREMTNFVSRCDLISLFHRISCASKEINERLD